MVVVHCHELQHQITQLLRAIELFQSLAFIIILVCNGHFLPLRNHSWHGLILPLLGRYTVITIHLSVYFLCFPRYNR